MSSLLQNKMQAAENCKYWKTRVLLTLATRFLIGHCWATDWPAIGGDTPAVSGVAMALYLQSKQHAQSQHKLHVEIHLLEWNLKEQF